MQFGVFPALESPFEALCFRKQLYSYASFHTQLVCTFQSKWLSQGILYHRIIEWFGLGETL